MLTLIRTLAPQIFTYIDRRGRPLISILFASTLGLLAFLAVSEKENEAFLWMSALSGLSSIFTWGSICFAHIRFRKAWRRQGHQLEELAFTSQVGVFGSWIGLSFNVLILIAEFWTGFSPLAEFDIHGARALTMNWFQGCLALPVVLAFYLPYKIWWRTPFVRSKNMDLKAGIRELNLAELVAEEETGRAGWPRWKKAYKYLC